MNITDFDPRCAATLRLRGEVASALPGPKSLARCDSVATSAAHARYQLYILILRRSDASTISDVNLP